MSFHVRGLDPGPYRRLFGRPDVALGRLGIRRVVADAPDAYPDRVELRDAAPGETLLLLNHVHQPARTPYRGAHAIYVREGSTVRAHAVDAVPAVLRRRLISLRAFSAAHDMVAADCVEGEGLQPLIERMLADPQIAYLHAHFAKRGCYAALVERG